MRNALFIGSVAALGRYGYLRFRETDEADPGEQVKSALAWGCGATLSALGTKALVQNGMAPSAAAAVTTATSALLPIFSEIPLVADVGLGGVAGGSVAAVAAYLNPNWPLGLRPRIFISHSFRDSELYDTLIETLRQARLDFFDHSVPVERQFAVKGRSDLLAQLESQIRGTSLLMFLAGRGAHLRPIIREELSMAVAAWKPILVIDPAKKSLLPSVLSGYPLKLRVGLGSPEIKSAISSMLAKRS